MVAFFKTAGGWVVKHLPAVLTGCGIAATAGSIVLAVDATSRAKEKLEAAEDRIAMDNGYLEAVVEEDGNDLSSDDLDSYYILGASQVARNKVAQELKPAQKLKIIWPCFIPVALSFAGSVLCVIFAHRVHVKRYGVLMAAYTATEEAYRRYYNASQEMIGGPKKQEELAGKVAQAYLDKPESENAEIISVEAPNKGDFLFLEPISYQFFRADMDYLEFLNRKMNKLLDSMDYVNFGDMLDVIGLASSSMDELHWDKNYTTDHVEIGKVLGRTSRPLPGIPVGTPCYVLTTNLPPQKWIPPEYEKEACLYEL